jgi:5'-3' exonuclease
MPLTAVAGLVGTLLALLRDEGATHVACAHDRVIRSFRNDLWPGYKTEAGVPADLLAQFPVAEEAIVALGIPLWAMVELEADDALATGALRFAADPGVEQVLVCTPDKDLAQVVRGDRVVLRDRRRDLVYDDAGVRAKGGVGPASIPDWLALVGDAADGIPGLPKWGEKSASAVLARWEKLEAIPREAADWGVAVRGAAALAASLDQHRDDAVLYRRLATLRRDVAIDAAPPALRWRGVHREQLAELCAEIGFERFLQRL